MEADVRFQTKFELWRRLLQRSGIIPTERRLYSQMEAFVVHSLLVLASRLVVVLLDKRYVDSKALISAASDGFHGWLLETRTGYELADEILGQLRRYDWYGSTQDILKEAYYSLIPKDQRKEFGEFYTPDDLANEVVQEVLDETWMDESITRCACILQGDNAEQLSKNLGVLDPSCGSGTFLFHAARHIGARLRRKFRHHLDLAPSILAMLIQGIDVHPVAVEMAKATLATAIPGAATRLRVALGDVMQVESGDELLDPAGLTLQTPGGLPLQIPRSLIVLPNSGIRLRQISDAIDSEQPGLFTHLDRTEDEQELQNLVTQLSEVVSKEGNHVWYWHLQNRLELERLRVQKVSRLIGNPPWLTANDTPEGSRKKTIEKLRAIEGVKPERQSSARGDLASVFTASVTRLYFGEQNESDSRFA